MESRQLTDRRTGSELPAMTWNERFMELFRRCVERYHGGDSEFDNYYSKEDREFLREIGYKPRELFDFVEDLQRSFGIRGSRLPAFQESTSTDRLALRKHHDERKLRGAGADEGPQANFCRLDPVPAT